jgi:hypothetical protein
VEWQQKAGKSVKKVGKSYDNQERVKTSRKSLIVLKKVEKSRT